MSRLSKDQDTLDTQLSMTMFQVKFRFACCQQEILMDKLASFYI